VFVVSGAKTWGDEARDVLPYSTMCAGSLAVLS
jgi:hypothetical protein